MLRAVRHRIQVGHGAHRSIAAVSRRPGAGQDRLLVRKTRLSEMHVHITKAGENGIGRVIEKRKALVFNGNNGTIEKRGAGEQGCVGLQPVLHEVCSFHWRR